MELAAAEVQEIVRQLSAVQEVAPAAARVLKALVAQANGAGLRIEVTAAGAPGPRLLTTAEVARMFQMSERAVRKWCEQGRIRAIHPGGPRGEWRIPADQFTATPEEMYRFHQTLWEIANSHGGPDESYER